MNKKYGRHKLSFENYKQQRLQELLSKTVITKSGCLEWKGFKDKKGYGHCYVFAIHDRVHRHIWVLIKGKIPENLHVLHSCDNPSCININHLFLGTNQDNHIDKLNKNREYRKITKPQIQILIKMAKKGILYKDIAEKFKLTLSHVSSIARKNGIKRKYKYEG